MFMDVPGEVAFYISAAIAEYLDFWTPRGRLTPPGLAQFGEEMSRTAFNRHEPTRVESLRAQQHTEPMTSTLLTRQQAAGVLQCSLRTVERRIADGALPVVHIGRSVRIRVEDLDAYLTQGE